MAVEAVDRAMRGQTSPVPIYEGEDGVIAWMLDGPDASYDGAAARGRAKPSAPSWTPTPRSTRPSTRRRPGSTWPASCTASTRRSPTRPTSSSVLIKTSHHTHYVIGSGANDPQKYEPDGQPRNAGPLDPVHLHGRPAGRRLAPRRLLRPGARRPRRTPWSCGTRSPPSRTRSGPAATTPWTSRRRRSAAASRSPSTDGTVITDEIAVADAHPLGARPFAREQYVNKFRTLAAGARRPRTKSSASSPPPQRLPELAAGELDQLNIKAADGVIDLAAAPKGLF